MRFFTLTIYLVSFGFVIADEPPVFKSDALKTLVNPDCSHCKDEAKRRAADLRENDRVLCWIRGKYNGGAIPLRFYLSPFRVISDTYGVFVYDADAGFVRGFEPSLDFEFHGWRNGVMVIRNKKDGTLYSALTGHAIDGPNKGKRLKVIPTFESDWGAWLKAYPDTVAYKMYPKYQAVDLPTRPSEESVKSRGQPDSRLAAETFVLGVRLGSQTKAYPLSVLEKSGGVLMDELDGRRIAIFWFAPTHTASAYLAQVSTHAADKQRDALTFRADDKNPLAPFLHDPTGSRWDIAGRCTEGSLKGESLGWIDSVQVKWFAWAAEYPQTALFDKK